MRIVNKFKCVRNDLLMECMYLYDIAEDIIEGWSIKFIKSK